MTFKNEQTFSTSHNKPTADTLLGNWSKTSWSNVILSIKVCLDYLHFLAFVVTHVSGNWKKSDDWTFAYSAKFTKPQFQALNMELISKLWRNMNIHFKKFVPESCCGGTFQVTKIPNEEQQNSVCDPISSLRKYCLNWFLLKEIKFLIVEKRNLKIETNLTQDDYGFCRL